MRVRAGSAAAGSDHAAVGWDFVAAADPITFAQAVDRAVADWGSAAVVVDLAFAAGSDSADWFAGSWQLLFQLKKTSPNDLPWLQDGR